MSRPLQPETEAVNADSFLDIVASVVSIMIIMVLMTGLKIKNTPVEAALTGTAAEVHADLTRELTSEQSLRADVLKTAAQIQTLQRETQVRKIERDTLALTVDTLEQRLQTGRQVQDNQGQKSSEMATKVSLVRSRLEQLEYQRVAVENAPAPPVQVESYPTPLSKTVDGREIHVQLRGGRLAVIPLESLIEKFRADAEHKVYKLKDAPELVDIVGPEGGFRLRYTLERRDFTSDEFGRHARSGSVIRLKHWTLIPVSDDLGETIDEALADGSQFRLALADRRMKGATVTLWTYPDSFDAFRRIKKELYRLDWPVAARPLPEGTPIGGSPDGSKSAAE